jgi:peroxiredoxin Q/BCP
MLKAGAIAPEIDALTSDGTRFQLSAQRGLCTVVYFFPKAFTPGCTAETKRFRDNFNELLLADVSLVGISTDDAPTQCRFAKELKTPFPLIGDANKSICRAYDVLWPILGVAQRVTYIVGRERRLLAAFRYELMVSQHGDEVMRFVDQHLQSVRAKEKT